MLEAYKKYFWIGSALLTLALIVGTTMYRDKIDKPVTVELSGEPITLTAEQLTGIEKTNINTATQIELEELPEIGPSTAKAIIEYRTQHPFTRIEQIMDVKGIGPVKYEKIKNFLVI